MKQNIQFNAGSRALVFAREPMIIRVMIMLLIFVLLSVPSPIVPAAFAEDVSEVIGGLKWTVDDNNVLTKVEADTNQITGEITIPAMVDDRAVLTIGLANGGANLFNNKLITKITIPEGVTGIANGSSASNSIFGRCAQLTEVNFPNSLLTIGNSAFRTCTALTNINFDEGPSQIKTIGARSFQGCSELTSIKLPNTLEDIGDFAFATDTLLSSIIIPDGLKELGSGVFNSCSSLKSITIPATVKTIGSSFCMNCTSLEEVFFCAMS